MTSRSTPNSRPKNDTERSQGSARFNHHGPLRAQVLASTGQDVSRCNHCDLCDKYLGKDMDLTIGEILQAANRNDDSVLTCQTLWNCDELLEKKLHCQAGIEVASVLLALIHLARDRGIQGPVK